MPRVSCGPARTSAGVVGRNGKLELARNWAGFGAATEKPHPQNPAVKIRSAFTVVPHLQLINHRGCFSATAGI
jgi:hypothetical protein